MSEGKRYKYHKVYDGYNFLSGPSGMENIVDHDMELVAIDDHSAALRCAKAEGLEQAAAHFRGEIMDPDGKEYLEGYNAALRHVSAWLELDADARAAQIEEGEST